MSLQVEVHLKFKMVPETLYLTVDLIDRFLEKKQIRRSKLQLVGVSALLVNRNYTRTTSNKIVQSS
jgi:G2/mitotic-specific cyclin-B, other